MSLTLNRDSKCICLLFIVVLRASQSASMYPSAFARFLSVSLFQIYTLNTYYIKYLSADLFVWFVVLVIPMHIYFIQIIIIFSVPLPCALRPIQKTKVKYYNK